MPPYKGFRAKRLVEFPRGTSTGGMARTVLPGPGVVRSRWDFLLARAWEERRVLQAGEYRFDRAASPLEVCGRIARGDIFYYELVVPEGQNMFDIAAVGGQLGLFSAEEFLAAARNPAMIRDLDPEALTLEGYLFPEHLPAEPPHHAGAAVPHDDGEVPRGVARACKTPSRTCIAAVTLASLVEKEGEAAREERPQIAAVFANRLRIGMKLDCDPTTIYAALLENRYRGTHLPQSDLDSDNPYNTYRHAGLPPGPIANPGLAFVARGARTGASGRALFRGAAGRIRRARILQQHRRARCGAVSDTGMAPK